MMTIQHHRPRHAKPRVSLWGRISAYFRGCVAYDDERTLEWVASMRLDPAASVFSTFPDACWADAQAAGVAKLIELAELQPAYADTIPLRVPPYLRTVAA
jgi:hypothetical protein